MIRQLGVRNLFDVALRHVTSRAVIGWVPALTNRGRDGTALFRVAGEAFQSEMRRRLLFGGFEMRIVARNAAEASFASPVALAKNHRIIVLEEITLGRSVASWRDHKNSQRVV